MKWMPTIYHLENSRERTVSSGANEREDRGKAPGAVSGLRPCSRAQRQGSFYLFSGDPTSLHAEQVLKPATLRLHPTTLATLLPSSTFSLIILWHVWPFSWKEHFNLGMYCISQDEWFTCVLWAMSIPSPKVASSYIHSQTETKGRIAKSFLLCSIRPLFHHQKAQCCTRKGPGYVISTKPAVLKYHRMKGAVELCCKQKQAWKN